MPINKIRYPQQIAPKLTIFSKRPSAYFIFLLTLLESPSLFPIALDLYIGGGIGIRF